MAKEYALYKGENLLAIGTAQEIADEMNVKKETVLFYEKPAYKKRVSKREKGLRGNVRILVALD